MQKNDHNQTAAKGKTAYVSAYAIAAAAGSASVLSDVFCVGLLGMVSVPRRELVKS